MLQKNSSVQQQKERRMRTFMLLSVLVVVMEAGWARGDSSVDSIESLLTKAGLGFSQFSMAANSSNIDSVPLPDAYTLFAPTNAAFEAHMSCFNSSKIDSDTKLEIIRYHIISTSLKVAAIQAIVANTVGDWVAPSLYNDQPLNFSLDYSSNDEDDPIITINRVSHIVKSNVVETSRATVHGINKVLIPPSLQALTAQCRASSSPTPLLQGTWSYVTFMLVGLVTIAVNQVQ